ncbi:MAG: prolipoprotein diacylglyceryl transferase [Candidatus Binatia bacterium]
MWPTIHLGGIAIPSFWAMAFLGFAAALVVARIDLRERGMDSRLAYDMILWAYVGGWVGARLFVIPTGWSYFAEDPIAFLVSSSGWVWYGGLIGGAVAVILWARRAGVPLLLQGDIAATALTIGQFFGRLGCQLSGDGDYGVRTDLPWAMSYPEGVVPTTERVHPTPLYDMLLLGVIFAVLWRDRRRGLPQGSILARYLVYTGAARFAVEFVRRNPNWLAGLTTAQWFSLASIAIGAWLWLRLRRTAEQRQLSASLAQ